MADRSGCRVYAVNRRDRLVVTDDGRLGEITGFYDADGDETEDIAAAVRAVAKLGEAEWLSIDLNDFSAKPN